MPACPKHSMKKGGMLGAADAGELGLASIALLLRRLWDKATVYVILSPEECK